MHALASAQRKGISNATGSFSLPWSLTRISTLPFCITPTQLYVVPRSYCASAQLTARAGSGGPYNADDGAHVLRLLRVGGLDEGERRQEEEEEGQKAKGQAGSLSGHGCGVARCLSIEYKREKEKGTSIK